MAGRRGVDGVEAAALMAWRRALMALMAAALMALMAAALMALMAAALMAFDGGWRRR